MKTESDNKAISHRFVEEVLNEGKLALIEQIFANHAAKIQHVIQASFEAFPDLHCTIEDELAEGNKVALRLTLTATHAGAWLGVPATGRKVRWPAMLLILFDNGKIVGGGLIQDELHLLRQIKGATMV